MPDSYLDDVPGVKDVRIRGGSLLPRRTVIEIDGARVYDDAVGGQTVIELRPQFAEQLVRLADFPGAASGAFAIPNTNADVYRFEGFTGVISLGRPSAGDRRKAVLLNMDLAETLTITHLAAGALSGESFSTATGDPAVLAANGGFCLVAYIANFWCVIG